MTSADIDPMMLTAIKLLHSKAKNSKDQLKAMLGEALAQRRQTLKLPTVKVSKIRHLMMSDCYLIFRKSIKLLVKQRKLRRDHLIKFSR